MRRAIFLALSLVALFVGSASVAFAHQTNHQPLLPDGDRRPVVLSASLEPPHRHNDLLEADLAIVASGDSIIAGYEYRWAGTTNRPIFSTDGDTPTVSYRSVDPDSRQLLQVRAIDSDGLPSEWHDAWRGVTPSVPNLIVAGDSIASGYTRQWFTSSGRCVDAAVSYGRTIQIRMASKLPPQWSPTYRNVAWAGAGVHAMADGGVDSCGVSHASQVETITAAADDGTWNVVVVTAGINSTNWSDVIVDLTKNTAFSLTDRGDKGWCDVSVTERWNIVERAAGITTAVRGISSTLRTETNADVLWTSYYPITSTRLAPGWTPIGSECDEEMTVAMKRLHSTIQAGLHGSVTWVDVDEVAVPTQAWAGWPHPNTEGHQVLGERVAAAIR